MHSSQTEEKTILDVLRAKMFPFFNSEMCIYFKNYFLQGT